MEIEERLPAEFFQEYPVCIDGEQACPPEDVGGPHGYGNYLKAIADPGHAEHEEYLRWRGPFDPRAFDPSLVYFDNPDERFEIAFSE